MTLIGNSPKGTSFTPKPFGPAYIIENDNQVKILEGNLKDQIFSIEKESSDHHLKLILISQDKAIGHCYAEYEKNSSITVWDVVLDASHRMSGLASLMVKIVLRELLFLQKTTCIRFRMVQLFKPDEKEIKLQNVGIGVMMYKLGLTCEYDLPALIVQNHVDNVEVIFASDPTPPAFKMKLNVYPFTLIAFIMDLDTAKPINNLDVYTRFQSQYEVIIDWVKHRQLVIGNANYLLKDDGIGEFVNRIANNTNEAELFFNRIKPAQ
jgi:hypothetical protein